MLNEGLIIGIVMTILLGAAFVYLYYRLMYTEKKMGMMESILVDVRMTLDSLLLEDRQEGGAAAAPPVPVSSVMLPPMPASTVFTQPEPLESSEAEPIPEEKFYSSVLEEAHEAAEEEGGSGGGAASQSIEQALEAIHSSESVGAGAGGGGTAVSAPLSATKYDTMTRSELLSLAEKRGVRVKRSASRNEVIAVLRRTEPSHIEESTAGTENASEPTGSLFPSAGSMDSGFPVDLGQSEQIDGNGDGDISA